MKLLSIKGGHYQGRIDHMLCLVHIDLGGTYLRQLVLLEIYSIVERLET